MRAIRYFAVALAATAIGSTKIPSTSTITLRLLRLIGLADVVSRSSTKVLARKSCRAWRFWVNAAIKKPMFCER